MKRWLSLTIVVILLLFISGCFFTTYCIKNIDGKEVCLDKKSGFTDDFPKELFDKWFAKKHVYCDVDINNDGHNETRLNGFVDKEDKNIGIAMFGDSIFAFIEANPKVARVVWVSKNISMEQEEFLNNFIGMWNEKNLF